MNLGAMNDGPYTDHCALQATLQILRKFRDDSSYDVPD